MSIISSAPSQEQTARQAVIIPFKKRTSTLKQFQPCIFCGKTMKVHNFKGKAVCIHCLHQIPAIFSFG